jgi:RNA polymerase sigma-70 factor (ECF subfamily)
VSRFLRLTGLREDVKGEARRVAPELRALPGGLATRAPEDDDVALVRDVVAGAPGAPARLWDRYAALVHGSVSRSLGPDADVDDLVQEVFLRLFDRLHTLRDASALRSFVYSIVVRVLRHELRRRWVRRIMRPLDRDVDEPAGPIASDDSREAVRRLYRILDRLDGKERTAYVLRQIEGLTLEETATAAGVSLATIKRTLARASLRVDAELRADPMLRRYTEGGGNDVG